MDVVCFTFPKRTFSRFDYFSTKSLELQSRYNTSHYKNTRKPYSPQCVRLHICKNTRDAEFPVEIDDILEKSAKDKIDIGNIEQHKSLKCYLKNQNEIDNSISLCIVDSKFKREIAKFGKTPFYIILIANDDITKNQLTDEFKCAEDVKLSIAKKDSISADVNNLLERISLAPLKDIAEDCQRMLQNDFKNFSAEMTSELSSSKSSYAQTTKDKFRTAESERGIRTAHSSTSRQTSFVAPDKTDRPFREKTPKSKKCITEINENYLQNSVGHVLTVKAINTRSKRTLKCQHMPKISEAKRRRVDLSDLFGLSDMELRLPDLRKNHEDDNECILECILALYRMSKVPETDKPNVPKQSLKVTEEMRKQLFTICSSIKSMGYRHRTFTVYAVKPSLSTAEAMRNSKIASVLKEHGIDDFAITPCAEDITPLMHVGAKIEARSGSTISLRSRTISKPDIVKGGTLGCIVQTNDGGQFGLLSKHVAEDCSDVYYVADNNDKKLGHILPETNRHQPGSLDISAAFLEEHIYDTGRKFKNLQENYVNGQLYHYRENEEDAIFGRGQPVYIRGASTNPGKGVITMPFVDYDMPTPVIQVEDRICEDGTVKDRFAEHGDSGAIVCADVPGNDVYAISMVVGTPDCSPVEGSITTRRRKYITIPLSKGLHQLESETGRKFEL